MATKTQVVQKPYSKPQRTYDHLYDPLHTVSSSRDHAKLSFKAQSSFDRLRKMPDDRNMFSELRHYPRQSYQLNNVDPVPPHVSRSWKGYANQYREALIRYKTFNYAPNVRIPPKIHPHCDVTGADRSKFFRRPILPYLDQLNVGLAGVVWEPPKKIPEPTEELDHDDTPKIRSVHVQTDYRDSETQTEPYSPEYVIQPGTEPELLTLATLSYSNGLPAGLAEVELIERARVKRRWEATLPPLNDLEQMEKRRRMMEEQERKEWAFRESEIQKLQDERLEVVKKLLQQREADHAALNDKRMEQLWSKKQMEKEKQVMRIRNNHIRALRKLTHRREVVDGSLKRRDIIEDYNNYASQVYAPSMTIGVYLDYGSEQFHVKSNYTSNYYGLLQLEASLPHHILNPRIKLPKKKVVGSKARQVQHRGQQLDQVYRELKARQNEDTTPKPLRLLEKVEKPTPRPPTPSVPVPDEEDEEQELMVILLQQILRGRSVQMKMYEGKNRRIELIRELQTTHALQGPQITAKRKEKEAVESKQRQKERDEHQASVVSSLVGNSAYTLLGQQLDYLSKELVRLQEERRLHALMLLAERERRMREAEESGLRQVEERIRRTEDELFKQAVNVHNETVDSYLEDVIISAVQSTADKQAREEIRKKAANINKMVHELEKTQTSLEKHETVAELVHTFLLPEVQKQTLRDKVKHQQRKHLLAAHNAIHKDIQEQ